jgi:hypothetical protein
MQNNEREATWEVLDGRKRPRRLDPAARSKQRPGHISAIAKSHDSLEAAGFQAKKADLRGNSFDAVALLRGHDPFSVTEVLIVLSSPVG